ncbi:hypothetical protein [uncultured Ruthenibacterium sp.]|uniref:hypothetical protein n=1 Tax=uncultured Ruthenibacterium sp. TaxID=1905347 RepID=UPI00349E58D5
MWWSTGPGIRTEGRENIGQTHSLAAGLLMCRCSQCGRIFFDPDARSTLCSDCCRKASRKATKRQFDGRAKGKDPEQAYDREYMFWYNRITN